MPLPLPRLSTDTLEWSFIQGSRTRVCHPRVAVGSAPGLSLEPSDSEGRSFYNRLKLGRALVFSGADYHFLHAVNTSADRCQQLGILLRTRANVYAAFENEAQFVFTCNECKDWDSDTCTVSVTPTTDDGYRLLLENWDQEYNILGFNPAVRRQVTATLVTLRSSTFVEFLRIDSTEEGDLDSADNWSVFLRNTSFISGAGTQGSTRERTVLLFRYRLRNVPMTAPAAGSTQYTAVDKSDTGWSVLIGSQNTSVTPNTIDYVKQPQISGFKEYKIGTYNDWNDPLNPGRSNRYGDQLLLLPCFETPDDYGYSNADYLKVTGNALFGQSLGGAYNTEADNSPGGYCLNVRRNVDQGDDEPANSKSLWWKFGSFKFGRCFPLLDAVHYVLGLTMAPTGQSDIVPPAAMQLSAFFSAPVNPVTGETGSANELPRLLLSAGSDVKRYGATEAATRVLISLKTLLNDLATLYDIGWFIDPATGWLRIEHQVYRESARAAGAEWDLRDEPEAHLPVTHSFRTANLPRYEEVSVTAGVTEDLVRGVYFGKASIDYGQVGCVNTREGQNKTSRTSARLTGDVAAMVLSGDTIPDSALAVLAPDALGELSDANRQVAISELLLRYHGYGAAIGTATVAGKPLTVRSLRPGREQAVQSVRRCTLRGLDGTTKLITRLGEGGEIGKAELDLQTGVVKITPWLPIPTYTNPGPVLPTRDFATPDFSTPFS